MGTGAQTPGVSPVGPLPPAEQLPPAEEEGRRIGLVYLSALAFIIGIVTGFGAVGFRDLIGLIHNVFFLGQFLVRYDANLFTPASPWGPYVILVPVAGAILVTFLVSTFAPEARGHGVPEVMDAIYYKSGFIRPIVAVIKSLASAIAIGTGAAIGREGPIIQIGSALGSTLGQIVLMRAGERIILVGAGAGAGIAATFNTPIGGVMFAIELMMPEVSARTFLPVAVATGTATFIGRFFFGPQPAFTVPELAPIGTDGLAALTLCLYALLGIIVGVAAAIFVQGLHRVEDGFNRIKNDYARHAFGMLLVGVMIYSLQQSFGHYYVEGVGYSTVQAVLLGQLSASALLVLLFACKLSATWFSLGSGSSGGIFSPSLFMGASLGGAFAAGFSMLDLPMPIDVPSFAMVGMGAMVGGATGAVMTAVTMIFEMTRDYNIVLPMIIAVAFSVGVRRVLSAENIYTMKLFRRGHVIPKALHANMFLVKRAREVMDTNLMIAPADIGYNAFLAQQSEPNFNGHILVVEGRRILGVVRITDVLRRAVEQAYDVPLRELARHDYTIVRENDVAFDVIQRIWRRNSLLALVVAGRGVPRPETVLGVITKEHIADSVASSVKVYPS